MSRARPVRLAVSVGCPSGIGPEVAAIAASDAREGAVLVLVGDAAVVARAAGLRGVSRSVVRVEDAESGFVAFSKGALPVLQPTASLGARDALPGRPSARGGAAQLAWIDAACDLAARGEADALVTGPVSKEAIARSGAPGSAHFLGHTEHLAARLGAREVVMAFAGERLTTALVTTHLPLADVPRAIDAAGVARATYWLARLLVARSPRARAAARIAVASLNPHAGEGGLLGHEESRAIAPGIRQARARLARDAVRADIDGPVPAETAFRRATSGGYDGVVAMYHDQATIPMKCVAFGEAVNVSLGLPIVRTSVDHGTGYDIAGRGHADADGMRAALALAPLLVRAHVIGKGGKAGDRATRTRKERTRSRPA